MPKNCKIICLNCQQKFDSPIQFGNSKAFFTSGLAGNITWCPHCGKKTGCNKENMIYISPGGKEGFVGDDTTN